MVYMVGFNGAMINNK